MLERLAQIENEAATAIEAAAGTAELEELRVRYLGRKAELTTILRGVAELPQEERGKVGAAANKARQALEELIERRSADLDGAELEARLAGDRVDVTLPGAPVRPAGHPHLITRTTRQIEDVMVGLGYRVVEGPEIEHDYYNFTALNHPPGHPARMLQDTFYVVPPGSSAPAPSRKSDSDAQSLPRSEPGGPSWVPDLLLRTHTSPVQIRAMEAQSPPIFVIVPGKVYRRDSDATHSPMFHQVEGLAIGEGITLADLQGTLEEMLRAIFGEGREARMRPHFFPFTEPSVEFDVSCFQCGGSGELDDGERCNLCKGIGWIEVGGAGLVDPNVLGFVEANGYDPERVQGFAFGMGVERIAMLRHGVPDLRRFFDNDVRMLGQFL
ncbi:MAG TPA: phenylalanine--tRNA ligase subunit alpha [Solirubrobacterales bacterium]|nr:phenylalanine--tRNA ligase subunit alpha [Solirubrobacterales bacterium]